VRKLLTFQLRNRTYQLIAVDNFTLKLINFSIKAFGSALIDHTLTLASFPDKLIIGKTFNLQNDMDKLFDALLQAEQIMNDVTTQSSKVINKVINWRQRKRFNLSELQ
jgi:hypothetical protein